MFGGRDDRLAPGTAAVGIARIEISAEFRGNDQPLPAARMAADMVPDGLLRIALGIEVRGVDEVAAEFDVPIQNPLRFLDARAPSKIFTKSHRPQAEWAYPKTGTAEGHVMIERHGKASFKVCSSLS